MRTAATQLGSYAALIPFASDEDLRAVVTTMGAVASVDLRGKAVAWTYRAPFSWLLSR